MRVKLRPQGDTDRVLIERVRRVAARLGMTIGEFTVDALWAQVLRLEPDE